MFMCSVNALNGLSSFLHMARNYEDEYFEECQRPKRAFFISTKLLQQLYAGNIRCQRPERAFFISTIGNYMAATIENWCQRPKRALFISTLRKFLNGFRKLDVSTP